MSSPSAKNPTAPPVSETGSLVHKLRREQSRSFEGKEISNIEVGKRLARVRSRFYNTASEAARQLGIPGPTYLAHENGTRGMRRDMAEFYAQKYGISTDWLLYGRGPTERTTAGTVDSGPLHTAVRDVVGPELLLSTMDVARDSKRVFVALDPQSAPARLPLLAQSDGYVLELAAVRPDIDTLSRKVRLRGEDEAGEPELLAVRDVFRLDPEFLRTNRAFLVKLQRNDLIDSMPRGQHVVVDPDDISFDLDDEGLFVFNLNATLVPVLVSCSSNMGQPVYFLWRAKERPAQRISKEEFDRRVVGRMIGAFREITPAEIGRIKTTLQPPASAEERPPQDPKLANAAGA